MKVRLVVIAFDAGTQIRAAIDQHVVSEYADAMTEGAVFPPIVVFHDGTQHYLADGFHRFLAAQRNQFREIDADVRPGTKEDALWFALGANKTNGKRLTEADKTHAVEVALMAWPTKMQREIAEQVGCSGSLVSKVAKHIAKNTGVAPDIRGQALANKTKRDAIRELVAAGVQSVEIRRKLKAHPTVIAEVRRECGAAGVDKSRRGRQQRRERMREMAAEGYSSRQMAAKLGLSEGGCRVTLKREGIDVPADKATRKTKHHNSNRIVDRIVMDAENLTEGVNLIEFRALDRAKLAEWLKSLTQSRDKLGTFIRRLMKEQQNGQAV